MSSRRERKKKVRSAMSRTLATERPSKIHITHAARRSKRTCFRCSTMLMCFLANTARCQLKGAFLKTTTLGGGTTALQQHGDSHQRDPGARQRRPRGEGRTL